jgi:site-specific recombinase XerC
MMFGGNSALAHQTASARLLRWCQAMDGWLAERQRTCAERTYRGSKTAWRRLLSRLGKTPWEIEPEDLAAHIAWMGVSGYAASTIKSEVGTLSVFYDWCAQRGIDPECVPGFNPAAGVPRPKVPAWSQARVLSRAEVRALLGILKRDGSIIGKRDYAFFTARLRCGVKLKNLQQLQWGQIEPGKSGVWLRLGAGEDRMPCPEDVWAAVEAYLEAAGRLAGRVRVMRNLMTLAALHLPAQVGLSPH